ncbi:MAG: hypothetical protein JWN86_3518 [Planctomycetota bacterium]|nr:hypothetical protein [Planctomycetota bacterium]
MRSRSRVIQIVAGSATLALLGLAGTLLPTSPTLAGRLQGVQEKGSPVDPPPVGQTKPAEATKDAAIPVVLDEGPPRATEVLPTVSETTAPPNLPTVNVVAVPAISPDPVQSADAFVARTRKEASDAVEALNKEATALRERLAKVEAGLARYQATLDALNARQVGRVERADPFRPAGDPGPDVVEPPLSPSKERALPKNSEKRRPPSEETAPQEKDAGSLNPPPPADDPTDTPPPPHGGEKPK